MQGWKLAAWWTGVIAYVCAVWVLHLFSVDDLRGQTSAAWVQAVGSVLAILAAVAVAAFQHSQDVAREERRDRDEKRRVVGVLHACAAELKSVVTAEGRSERDRPRNVVPNFKDSQRRLDLIKGALNGFSPNQMPTPEVHVLLHNLRFRVGHLIEVIEEEVVRAEVNRFTLGPVNWNMHYGHASELLDRLAFELRRIDNPSEIPPWW